MFNTVFLSQLWVNALYFWTDLHYYRELFYQDGLDPYRVQREAQVSTRKHTSCYHCQCVCTTQRYDTNSFSLMLMLAF